MSDEKKIERPEPMDIAQRDAYFWQEIGRIAKERDYDVRDLFEHFPAYIQRRFLTRFLSHYELFKNVIDLPGSIVEIGVFRGRTMFSWSHFMETFCPGDRRRMVYGFDHFKGLTDFDDKQDGAFNKQNDKVVGGWQSTEDEVRSLMDLHMLDQILPGYARCELISGDVFETIPKFLAAHPGLKISLLHMDIDLYRPTLFVLEQLYPLVVTGGVVCFDEYGVEPWQGETNAADEFFSKFNPKPKLIKHPFTAFPSGYFIKE